MLPLERSGGPVSLPRLYNGKNKSFFSFSVETSRGSQIQQLLNPTVPVAAWRQGDFSALAPATVIRDPYASNAPFAGNRIPVARINPVSQKIQDRFWPLPNFGNLAVLVLFGVDPIFRRLPPGHVVVDQGRWRLRQCFFY